MEQKEKPMSFIRKNYHWVIAIVILMQFAIHSGAGNNLSGMHLIPVSEDLSITRAEFSYAISAKSIMATLFTFLSGFFLSRFGFRKSAAFGLFLASFGYFFLANAKSYFALIVGCGIMGITNGFCTTAAVSWVVSEWFHRYRGSVLGIATAASGVGGSIMCLIQGAAMEAYTWRASLMTCSAFVGAIGIVVLIFVRNRPDEMGLRPFGEGMIEEKSKRRVEKNWVGISFQKLIRRPSFYLMILVTFLSSFCVYLVFSVVMAHFLDRGFSQSEAAGLQSLMMLLFGFAKFFVGVFSDRIGAKIVNLVCCIFCVIGLVMIACANNYAVAVISVAVYCVSIPMITITVPLLSVSLFGIQAKARYIGIFMSVINLAKFVADPIANLMFGRYLSYCPTFFMGAGIAAVTVFLYLLLYRLAKKDQQKIIAES